MSRSLLRSSLSALCAGLILTPALDAQLVEVGAHQKLSNDEGGLGTPIDGTERFGWDVTGLGDLDGDGVEDIAVSAYRDDVPGFDQGTVRVVFLNSDGTEKSSVVIGEGAGGFTENLEELDWFGWGLEAVGDLNGDGIVELAVGAPGDDDMGSDTGAVYILFLDTDGTVKSHSKISTSLGISLHDFNYFGCGIGNLGDVNGDGFDDIAVGAFGDIGTGNGGGFRGSVFVLNLTNGGLASSLTEITEGSGGFVGLLEDGDEFGWDVTGVGDLDGNGVGDMAVSALLDDDGEADAGAVYVFMLDSSGAAIAQHKIHGGLDGDMEGLFEYQDWFGRGLGRVGDLDGDGDDELLVGAAKDDDGGDDFGAVYILQLDATGAVEGQTKISATAGGFAGSLDVDDQFGRGLAAIGDVDGNGVVDLAVGASRDDDGGADTGALYVLFMQNTVWTDLGNGLAGTNGLTPVLVGEGELVPNDDTVFTLTNALPLTTAALVLGVTELNAAFKGGVMVPFPNLILFGLPTDAAGQLVINFPWGASAPGFATYWQYWVTDAGGPLGYSASNAVRGVSQ